MFCYVYILQSLKDKLFYIGFTSNLNRRLNEHRSGRNKSTSRRLPLKLIFFEAYLNKHDALRRESYFKTNKGKVTLRQMLKEYLRSNDQ
ncbi:MAG: excinuclease ABC subunit C [Candidatus Komeilibacteria bacterium CG_4_10_14_0_2_um_filter_37_10]|uniref:Excinuclease ABC subunit C n=1 Tax=Candidatus Komeilibacteria bacterium CG_4_10_14_0_2_um_filter_37_10 TaxID=1974470 RepID=A0A2M7VE73_9BACT|nr:MAG: excinuclease ABC subunit C [Candidatus Komeilibacteria bacterium CG_4_10_14_0_2_um_filter_37_10]PJA92683.1 MAG: excinuclease ABC subunit C [Candidatus Komeilibacteria bacterium CG_4_9_14_3_um_filter_37_5]